MAEGKKSFIAYSDWHGMFSVLPDEIAGKLIKHIFSYVNDENPQSDDYVINALFEQIKAQLKRDLKKWEEQRIQRVEAGKRSAEIRATKSNDRSTTVNETERNPTVNDNVNVNVSVNDNVKREEKPSLNEIKSLKEKKFKDKAVEFTQYDESMIEKFCLYWTESNENSVQLRFEKEKTFDIGRRLTTWSKNERNFNSSGTTTQHKRDLRRHGSRYDENGYPIEN